MKYILDDKEYQKLHQSNVDLKKHNKALKDKIKELQDRAEIKVDGDVKKETKSAIEMFEELGFRQTRYEGVWDVFDGEIFPTLVNYQHKVERNVFVDFYLQDEVIKCFAPVLDVEEYFKLHRAINKQIEELGWQ